MTVVKAADLAGDLKNFSNRIRLIRMPISTKKINMAPWKIEILYMLVDRKCNKGYMPRKKGYNVTLLRILLIV